MAERSGNLIPFLSDLVKTPEPVETQVANAMRSAGLDPPSGIQVDGQIHRFATSPKPGDDNGWYVIYGDNVPAGAFGCWRQDIRMDFCANIGRELTLAEHIQNQSRVAEAKKRHEENRRLKNERAAETCQEIWDRAPAISPEYPYLKRKGIGAHVARSVPDGRMVVPLYDISGELSTLQYIDQAGGKLYHAGGSTKGKFCQVGAFSGVGRLYFAEGYATGVTVHEALDVPVIIVYSAGNIEPVVGLLRGIHPAAEFVIVADNDATGVGRNHADQAASKHGASVVMPPNQGDANDYRLSGGDLVALLTPSLDMVVKLKVVFGSELGQDYEAPDEVIQGLVVAKAQTVLYGDSNSGKTFFALSLAYAVSEGCECYGRRVDGGLVIYLATEAPGSIRARMQALKKFHNSDMSKLAMVPVPLNFYSGAGDASDVIRLVEQISRARNLPVRMIIADTLARMSAGANENSGEDMGPVMDRFSLVAEHTGAAVVIIHHSGKDQARGARGWSGIRAHIDTEIEVEEVDGVRFAKVTKQRELSSKGDEIAFELQVVDMGLSKFGAEVTTCVAIPSTGEKRAKVDKATRERYRILNAAFEFSGMDSLDGHPYITRSAFMSYLTAKENKAEPAAKKFLQEGEGRFIGSLIIAGTIQSRGSGWIVTDPEIASVMNILASSARKNTPAIPP
jgi:putative DNA primase/helicase